MDKELPISHLWRSLGVCREDVTNLIRPLAFQNEWASHQEAGLLALAETLKRSADRQARLKSGLRSPTSREFTAVARAAAKLQRSLVRLQSTNDPPPLLAQTPDGKTAWDLWWWASRLQPSRGRPDETDSRALHELFAVYEVALQPHWRSDDDLATKELRGFIERAFAHTRRLIEKSKQEVQSFSMPPTYDALRKSIILYLKEPFLTEVIRERFELKKIAIAEIIRA